MKIDFMEQMRFIQRIQQLSAEDLQKKLDGTRRDFLVYVLTLKRLRLKIILNTRSLENKLHVF